MSGEICTLVKGFLTLVTFIRLLVGVCSLMLEKCRKVEEGLSTMLALIGLLIRVNSLVLDEQGAVSEGFPTFFAFTGLFTGVKAIMLNKVSMLFKDLATDLTLIGLLIDLIWGKLEVIGKSSATLFQFITFLTSKILSIFHRICVIDKGVLVHFIKFITGRNSYRLSNGFTCFLWIIFLFQSELFHLKQGV